MNKQKNLTGLVSFSILSLPVIALAQGVPGTIGSLDQLIDRLKPFIWSVFGIIALICFLIAGILFLTAAGNPEKVAQARTAFLWGVAGVVVGILAFSIVAIIQTAVT